MSLSKRHAVELTNLRFNRQAFEDKVYPTDIFEHEGELWVVGGRILPNGNLTCKEEIFNKGIWIPTQQDLIDWLENNDCTFSIAYGGMGYKAEITAINGRIYKGKGGTLEYSLFNAIIDILKDFGGNPVNKDYEVVKAEFISKEDL